MSTKKPLLTAKQLGEELTTPPKTIRDWARDGLIPSYCVQRKNRIYRFDLEEVLEAIREPAK